jgi:hypothetical protein
MACLIITMPSSLSALLVPVRVRPDPGLKKPTWCFTLSNRFLANIGTVIS